uniref:RNA polymerase II subunit A C-terminal domain phosphatase n=1 Tax=Mola mola TaxID=94237 RepID=A0A3Q3XLQ5_MOLML
MEDRPSDSGGGAAAVEGPAVQVVDICWSSGALPLRLLEWKVKPGSLVNVDSVLALCVPIPQEQGAEAARLPERKVKSDRAGIVKELCCQLGQVIPPGGVIVRIEECSHPVVMKGLCAECGQDLTQLQSTNGNQQTPISTATVSMVHSVPELMVSSEQAEQLGREDQQRLHRNKKLVLMVDLDQTLIHTTEQHCQRMSNKVLFPRIKPMLHTRLRPHCKEFLEKIAKLYELHVFTFGSRLYAHTIAGFLDPEKKLFSHRILSRDECIDPFSKTGNLRNLFPCGDTMVCIIDDREDVWKFAPNLITVKKYIYFQGTGDINAPPGSREAQMEKKGNTETAGILGGDGQNNGPRIKVKDLTISGKEESTPGQSSQGLPSNERTHPTRVVEDGSEQSKRSDTESGAGSKETPLDDGTNVKDNENNRILAKREAQDSAYSSAPSHESNNMDFDLSSDSDNESITDKPPSLESDGEGRSNQANKSEQEEFTHETGDRERQGDSKDPELGNGCLDRREPETESQNSEQSGVTMGEELLDQSMEDEEEGEEEADNDQDDHLIYLEEVLERIHAEYYTRYEAYLRKEAPEIPDIRKIVPELKSQTLEGTMIVFSGLYPTNYPMERTREFYHAKALGAKIGKSLLLSSKDPSQTTHLIAARAGTEKVRQALGCKHLHVVNPDWLWSCLERWERVEEQLYPLKEDYSKTPRSNSPAAFLANLGSLQKPIFQPAAIHHKPPPPAPEIRTYDPVTGKLIRRGPQLSRPAPFVQTSGPLLRSDQREQHYNEAGSSQDDEQPGPSRRKRQPSMSETMPLYTLCKEDLESMDKEVFLHSETSGKAEKSIMGHKRKHDEAKEEEDDDGKKKEAEAEESADESSKDSNEEEGGSSSEADEMAAALEAELNDFI